MIRNWINIIREGFKLQFYVNRLLIFILFLSSYFALGNKESEKLTQQAMMLIRQNQFKVAIQILNAAIKADKEDVQAWYLCGVCYYMSGKNQEAIENYNQALLLSPNNSNILINRSATYGKLRKYNLAIKDYNLVITANPKSHVAYLNRGLLYQKQHKLDLAIKDYSEAIKLSPFYAKALLYRGYLYYRKGEYLKARKDLKISTTLQMRDYPQLYLFLARAYTDNKKAAQIKLNQYLKLRKLPEDDWFRVLAEYFNDKQSKVSVLSLAKKQSPQKRYLMEAYYFLGAKEYYKGNNRLAKKYLKKCLSYKIEEAVETDCALDQLKMIEEVEKKNKSTP